MTKSTSPSANAEPWDELGWTKEQFVAYLLDLVDKRIAEAERALPCNACSACQWTTCRKAGAFQYRRLRQLGTASLAAASGA
jgi:hypothetical protein